MCICYILFCRTLKVDLEAMETEADVGGEAHQRLCQQRCSLKAVDHRRLFNGGSTVANTCQLLIG
jgi:hypothetical protein